MFILKGVFTVNYSKEVDKKWQKRWKQANMNEFDYGKKDNKLYCMDMFPYPSGKNLHLGHWFNFAFPGSWARMKNL